MFVRLDDDVKAVSPSGEPITEEQLEEERRFFIQELVDGFRV